MDRTESAARGGEPTHVAAGAAQEPSDSDCDGRAAERADEVDPIVREVAVGEVGRERARGVHRRAADRARPQAGEDDVAPNGDRAECPDVLSAGGRARIVLTSPTVSASSTAIACQASIPAPGSVAPSDPCLPSTAQSA